jgi:hypothetical protein
MNFVKDNEKDVFVLKILNQMIVKFITTTNMKMMILEKGEKEPILDLKP